jgi:hypothetical protein
MKAPSRYNTWVSPPSYAVGAVVLGLAFPRLEVRLFHGLTSTITIPAAMAIYSSIASACWRFPRRRTRITMSPKLDRLS